MMVMTAFVSWVLISTRRLPRRSSSARRCRRALCRAGAPNGISDVRSRATTAAGYNQWMAPRSRSIHKRRAAWRVELSHKTFYSHQHHPNAVQIMGIAATAAATHPLLFGGSWDENVRHQRDGDRDDLG